jgi:hypothetical protein
MGFCRILFYDPNQERDDSGRWGSGPGDGEESLPENWSPKYTNHEKLTNDVKTQLEKMGINDVTFNTSETDFGRSDYFYLEDAKGEKIKLRISDHSVENIGRVFNEYHIHTSSVANGLVRPGNVLLQIEKRIYPQRFEKIPVEYKSSKQIEVPSVSTGQRVISERTSKSGNKVYTIQVDDIIKGFQLKRKKNG